MEHFSGEMKVSVFSSGHLLKTYQVSTVLTELVYWPVGDVLLSSCVTMGRGDLDMNVL